MIVNSFNPEFGYELISVLPYAYYLYINNELEGTISAPLTEPLYYFSPNHKINHDASRGDAGVQKLIQSNFPNALIHTKELNIDKYIPPPYKEYYANNTFKWDKPTLVISNKYGVEWGCPPINYFSLELLDEMFNFLKNKYQIVYIGVDIIEEIQDDSHTLYLGDLELCKKHPEVIVFQELLKSNNLNWNELQLKVFANCEKFITIVGGVSVLASYFGGTNIIYCKQGSEMSVDSFNRWYHIFGGSKIHVVSDYSNLLEEIKKL